MTNRVKENWPLVDTVRILGAVRGNGVDQPGWVETFDDLADLNDLWFFSQRNRSAGLMWCNTDSIDTMPYPFELKQIGVRFGCTTTGMEIADDNEGVKYDNVSPHIFTTDLVHECSLILSISQDEKLKINCGMLPPGRGISGDGYGSGQPLLAEVGGGEMQSKNMSAGDAAGATAGATAGAAKGSAGGKAAHGSASAGAKAASPMVGGKNFIGGGPTVTPGYHMDSFSNGHPALENQFDYPISLEIPKGANVSCRLQFSEAGKVILRALNLGTVPYIKSGFGLSFGHLQQEAYIQVWLTGVRRVSQRGELTA